MSLVRTDHWLGDDLLQEKRKDPVPAFHSGFSFWFKATLLWDDKRKIFIKIIFGCDLTRKNLPLPDELIWMVYFVIIVYNRLKVSVSPAVPPCVTQRHAAHTFVCHTSQTSRHVTVKLEIGSMKYQMDIVYVMLNYFLIFIFNEFFW